MCNCFSSELTRVLMPAHTSQRERTRCEELALHADNALVEVTRD